MNETTGTTSKDLAQEFMDTYNLFFREKDVDINSPSRTALETQFDSLIRRYGPDKVRKVINQLSIKLKLRHMNGEDLYNFPEGDITLVSLFQSDF